MRGWATVLLVAIWAVHFIRNSGLPVLLGAIAGTYQVA
jgi:hypothetical protein